MAIHTTNYNSKKMKEAVASGQKVYGISRYPYRWFKENTLTGYLLQLAPTEKLLDAEEWDWEEFKIGYLKHLNRSKNKVSELLKRLDAENAVLCCFEKDVSSCHRGLISNFINQHSLNITTKEL